MPEKRLIANELRQDGAVCALGAIGSRRGLPLETFDPYDYDTLSGAFGVARQLIQEIEWVNDESSSRINPEGKRWASVRAWAVHNLLTETK